jgi:predicted AlkP superfamily phosphohydrolase/phosphomutase
MSKAGAWGAAAPREGGNERMDRVNGSRVLMVGLDSADLDYIQLRLGSLPNLRRLLSEGVVRRLESPGSVMSACVWPTFFTASHPGEHGQYFPIQWDPAKMELRHVASDWIDSEPFWRPLAREGLQVTTLDVQMVYPNRTSAGVDVVNWGSNSLGAFHCNNPEIAREIERRFGSHVLEADVPVEKSPKRFASIRKSLLAGVRGRGELSRWLLANTTWDLFISVFQECHRAGHYFWKDNAAPTAADASPEGDVLLEIHRAIDEEVGALLEGVDLADTSVIVFSLLGMGPNRAQMHLVPEIVERINAAFAAPDGELPAEPPRPRRNLMAYLRDRLPAPLQERVAMAVPVSVRDWVVGRAHAGSLDWRSTPGFALPTGGEGYIRLNLSGREARGFLEPGSAPHRRYVDSIRESFLSLRNAATGEPLVDAITDTAERFPGPRSGNLPDFSVTWRPGGPATLVHSERLGTFRGRLRTGRDGNHRAVAFAAVAGPAARSRQAQSLDSIVGLAQLVRDLAVARSAPA